MRNKHWLAIADALRKTKPNLSGVHQFNDVATVWMHTVSALADTIQTLQSPRCAFDRGQWIAYIMRE